MGRAEEKKQRGNLEKWEVMTSCCWHPNNIVIFQEK